VAPLPERAPDAGAKAVEIVRPSASRRPHRRVAETVPRPPRAPAPSPPGKKIWDPDSIYLP
jgi:hypothetical protein